MYPCLKFELHVAINASWIFTMDSCESVFCLFLIYPTTCALNYGMIQISVFGCVENIEIAHNGCLKLNKRDVYTETKLCPTFSGNIWSSCYFIVPKKLAAILKILGRLTLEGNCHVCPNSAQCLCQGHTVDLMIIKQTVIPDRILSNSL